MANYIARINLSCLTVVSVAYPADVANVLRAEPKCPPRVQLPDLEYDREKCQKSPGFLIQVSKCAS